MNDKNQLQSPKRTTKAAMPFNNNLKNDDSLSQGTSSADGQYCPLTFKSNQRGFGFDININRESSSPLNRSPKQANLRQLELRSIIRGYETRLKNQEEEHRENMQDMENRLKDAIKEKHYWQNIAKRYAKTPQFLKENSENLANRELVAKLENQKKYIALEKEQILKEMKHLTFENIYLKQKLAEMSRNQVNNSKNKYTSHPRNNRNETPPRREKPQQEFPVRNLSVPMPVQAPLSKETQVSKINTEKMEVLIRDLNESIIRRKIGELNSKYSKGQNGVFIMSPQPTKQQNEANRTVLNFSGHGYHRCRNR